MTDSDVIYKNAPLVEVIVEIRWDLVPIASLPGAFLDPHFSALEKEFKNQIKNHGFGFVERLIPENIPQEIVAEQPIYRFRTQSQKWPLFQIGPGLFAANIIPPYEGWQDFREVLCIGLECLLNSYPAPDKFLNIKQIELRYLDAFTRDHGYENYKMFLKEHLGITSDIKDEIIEKHVINRKNIKFINETILEIKKPSESLGFIKASPGRKEDKDAIISEFIIRKVKKPIQAEKEEIIRWFDEAHSTVSDWFTTMSSDKLKELMGPSRPVRR